MNKIPHGETPPGHSSVFGTHIALNKTGCPFAFLSDPRIPDTTRFDHGIMSWRTPDALYTKNPGLARQLLLNKRNPKSKGWYRFHHRLYNYRIPADILTYSDADHPHVVTLRKTYSSELSAGFDANKARIEDHIAGWVDRIGLGPVDLVGSTRSLNAEITHLMLFGELPPDRWFTKVMSDINVPAVDPKRHLAHLLWPFMDRLPTPYVAVHRLRARVAWYLINRLYKRYRDNTDCLLGRIRQQGIEAGNPEFVWQAFPGLLMAVNALLPFPMTMSLYVLGEDSKLQERVVRENIGPAVVKEMLRLYPPVTTISRRVKERVESDGIAIEEMNHAEDQIYVNHTAIHRDRRGWTRPDEFLVDRWLPGWKEDLDSEYRVYMPFGLGARSCPGAAYATKLLNTFVNVVISKREVSNPSRRRPNVAEGSLRIVTGRFTMHFAARTGA